VLSSKFIWASFRNCRIGPEYWSSAPRLTDRLNTSAERFAKVSRNGSPAIGDDRVVACNNSSGYGQIRPLSGILNQLDRLLRVLINELKISPSVESQSSRYVHLDSRSVCLDFPYFFFDHLVCPKGSTALGTQIHVPRKHSSYCPSGHANTLLHTGKTSARTVKNLK